MKFLSIVGMIFMALMQSRAEAAIVEFSFAIQGDTFPLGGAGFANGLLRIDTTTSKAVSATITDSSLYFDSSNDLLKNPEIVSDNYFRLRGSSIVDAKLNVVKGLYQLEFNEAPNNAYRSQGVVVANFDELNGVSFTNVSAVP